MATIVKQRSEEKLDGVIRDAGGELERLRREVASYRSTFEAARLIVGHEFIRPLTAISGYVELIEEASAGSIGDRERAYFDKVKEGVRRLEELVDTFVQMLRFEAGTAEVRSLELARVEDMLERVRDAFGDQASRIRLEPAPGLPPLYFRRRCLEVAVENIVSNALKHGGDSGPVRVTASLKKDRRGDAREELLVVSVEDRGIGIPEDRLEDIFNPFFRLESGRETRGLGLGLALVKSIVRVMGGEIHVRSKPGAGTAITIAAPVWRDPSAAPEQIG